MNGSKDTTISDAVQQFAAQAEAQTPAVDIPEYDVVIVGAGISGINMAYRLQENLAKKSYTIIEARANMGGTWDLMRYPGIRSDSDLYTFSFAWAPWTQPTPIAEGGAIVKHMKESAARYGIDKHIQYRHKVKEAHWHSRLQNWTLVVEVTGEDGEVTKKEIRAKFVVLGTGYYDYDKPQEAQIPGLENFKGKVIHPQFWPEDLDYAGKSIAVVGSGATAVTLIPALAKTAGRVTMVQRSPSYIVSIPNRAATKAWWQRILPQWLEARITRFRWLIMGFLYRRYLSADGEKTKLFLAKVTQAQLPKRIPYSPHFEPKYLPWAQRMCLCPDGDFFKALHSGNTDVATGVIKTVTEDKIVLESGQEVEADILITATGLRMKYGGNCEYYVDGEHIEWGSKFMYRGWMVQDMPNLALVQGYTKASWTLGADATAVWVIRMLKHLDKKKLSSATPRIPKPGAVKITGLPGIMGLTSTYIMSALDRLPKTSDEAPWQGRGNYLQDLYDAKFASFKNVQFTMATA
ncbi:FAD/NAD(P)-binding domain-containing protein [Trichodelitschia bisporula]|uniref:FAD/NAD(P)-binding domain-containing protein n=1 Tax=Trichodelitschia bisporula TaxID=703511 RepID=A0A6G1HQ28_9PEZI|nr:FAD/NAD(P)-binding domain-containing protein [Trichodelitschia bisporula]